MQNNITGKPGPQDIPSSQPTVPQVTTSQPDKKPRIQSRQPAEIITDENGRRFRNGVELFYESDCDSDTEQNAPKQPRKKPNEVSSASTPNQTATDTESVESRCHRLKSAIKAGDIDTVRQLIRQFPDLVTQTNKRAASLLHRAIINDQTAIAELLVDNGASLDYRDSDGSTSLIRAIQRKQGSLAEALIRKGAAVDQADSRGWTPLMVAAAIGNTHLMQLLIAHGASIDKTSKQSATALIVATGGGQIDAVRLLLSKGASVNHADNSGWRPLSIAAHKGHEDIARLLIKHHAGLELSTQKGWTPLMTATKAGHLSLVRLLLEQKANINHKSKAGVSALMLAAGNGDTEIAELLVHNGASVNEADKDGQTPLIYAEEKGHYEAARLLIRVKAAIDQPDSLGRTPLLIAVQKGQTSLASLLIANGATIDRADNSGSTPLTIACDKNHPDILKLLLGSLPNRAAIDARTPKNITLLMHAARSGHTEIADILLSHGATINLPANGGWTPLMSAVLAGHKTMVELLISRGAEIDRGKQDGWTALMIACQIGHAKIVDLLLDKARFSIPQLAKMIRAASINGHAKVLELLFEKAKTSAIFSKTMLRFWDSNPAEFAIKNGHADALAVLIKNGIRPDLSSQTVWQDLMKALDKGNAELLHLAIDELPSSLLWSSLSSFGQGTSPVHLHVQQALIHAIRQDRQDIVKLLMKAGAKPDFLDTNATTPVQVAIQEGNLPMLQLLLGPDVKLNRHKPDDKLSAELLLAISSEPPDPLLIDTLIDFDNAALMKKGGFGFKLDFQQLADRVSQLLMAAQKDKNNPRLQLSAIITMLCGEFGLSYLAANTLADAILQIAGIYATDLKKDVARPTASAPTAAQLRVAFAESIVSSQLLQDLMRYDDQAPEQCYPNATLMPELARKLVRNTARQAGLLVVSAESVLSEPDAALAKFLNTLTPITTSQQIRDFMSGAGWHPMVAALVAECWNSLDKPPAKAGLIAAISQRLSTPEFAEKIEYQSSDAARHYLLGQLSRLRDLMRI